MVIGHITLKIADLIYIVCLWSACFDRTPWLLWTATHIQKMVSRLVRSYPSPNLNDLNYWINFCSQLIRSKFRCQTWARKLKHYIPPLHSRKMLCFSPNLRMTVSPVFINHGNRHGKAGNQYDMLSVFTLLGWYDPGNVTWFACAFHSNTALNNSYGWELDIALGQWISCTSFQPSRSSNRYGKA